MLYSYFLENYSNDINSYMQSKSHNYIGIKNLRRKFKIPKRCLKRYIKENNDMFIHTTDATLVSSGKYTLNLWKYKNTIKMDIEIVE